VVGNAGDPLRCTTPGAGDRGRLDGASRGPDRHRVPAPRPAHPAAVDIVAPRYTLIRAASAGLFRRDGQDTMCNNAAVMPIRVSTSARL
jgi:hypothetical protein